MPVTSDEMIVKKKKKGPEKHNDTVNGRQSMKSTMQTQQGKDEQPPVSGGGKKIKFYRVNVERNTLTPLCKKKGSRWERSFTAGASVCYRGHKSAAWHHVSSVGQRETVSGHVSINKPTDKLTARETHKPQTPKDYDQLD